jgi:citrate synthase
MNQDNSVINTGLRGVTVASTRISDVDGTKGKLIYRGYLAKDLAQDATFEEVVHLLIHEKLPDQDELKSFRTRLSEQRHIPPEIIQALQTRPKTALPMDILQSAVPMLAHHDPDIELTTKEIALQTAIKLIAKLPTIVAAWERIRNSKPPIDPDPKLDHAANFLYMMTGNPPDEETAKFFDVALILHAEHSFNASTFSARQVASTTAHMYASVAAAIGSLSGALHGGANTRVMKMLIQIGTPGNVESFITQELEAGKKIMGLGHAVYKVDDPRALILAPMSKKVGEKTGQAQWYEISTLLEQKGKEAFKKHKNMDIFVNVDFYSASLFYTMGIPLDLFTPVFAISRISGWCAHVLEEQFAEAAPKAVLYRPESEYIGEYCGPDECSYVLIDDR